MFKPNPTLFDPIARVENTARRAMNIMCTAPDVAPKDSAPVAKEVQEIKEALQAFEAAIVTGQCLVKIDLFECTVKSEK
jgi:hypothetical protein